MGCKDIGIRKSEFVPKTQFLCGFIEKNKILYDLQFGFRKNHNTTQPLILFLDKIYTALNKDNPEYTIAVFLDLKKAFDTTSHTILIDKLNTMDLRGLPIFGLEII